MGGRFGGTRARTLAHRILESAVCGARLGAGEFPPGGRAIRTTRGAWERRGRRGGGPPGQSPVRADSRGSPSGTEQQREASTTVECVVPVWPLDHGSRIEWLRAPATGALACTASSSASSTTRVSHAPCATPGRRMERPCCRRHGGRAGTSSALSRCSRAGSNDPARRNTGVPSVRSRPWATLQLRLLMRRARRGP